MSEPGDALAVAPPARFATALGVEFFKLRRSLALLLALVAPALVSVFVFFNVLRMERPLDWNISLQTSAAIWAYFMLPMSVTALAALLASTEHVPRAWDTLRALPVPRWHLYAAKAVVTLAVVAAMSLALALSTGLALNAAGWLDPSVAPSGEADVLAYASLLSRIFVSALLLIAVQLWIGLRYASFVPTLAVGIGGTFFAVVATSAKAGVFLPWQIPVNQLAADPARADLALLIGGAGGAVILALMLWRLSVREVL